MRCGHGSLLSDTHALVFAVVRLVAECQRLRRPHLRDLLPRECAGEIARHLAPVWQRLRGMAECVSNYNIGNSLSIGLCRASRMRTADASRQAVFGRGCGVGAGAISSLKTCEPD